jgi:NADH pyrophosphatase NudC (nudix superfamily)
MKTNASVNKDDVISGLKTIVKFFGDNESISYSRDKPYWRKYKESAKDALSFIKEQATPKKVNIDIDYARLADDGEPIYYGNCPQCGMLLNSDQHYGFCGDCGQAIRWK